MSMPRKAAMFEDLARNLAVPHALGMTTVLVVPERTREVFREGWELEGRDAPHVDHVTDDLVGFLQSDRAVEHETAQLELARPILENRPRHVQVFAKGFSSDVACRARQD